MPVTRAYSTHGLSKSPEYKIFAAMIARCTHSNHPQFADYGGRGIRVADEWFHDFGAFIEHIGRRPSPELTLGRFDINGDYAPGNVRWATRKENCLNRRNNRLSEINGEFKTICQWAKDFNIKITTLHKRLQSGMSLEDALNKPVNKYTRK